MDNIELGEITISVPAMPKGEVKFSVRFTYDINGILEVEVNVPITQEQKRLVIVNKELSMTESQIEAKLKEFEKIKINPASEEENQYVLDWGGRLYMQCSGELQQEIGRRLDYFHQVMQKDAYKVRRVRKYMTVYLGYVEGIVNQFVHLSVDDWKDGSWYQEESEEDTKRNREIDEEFKAWEEENFDEPK